MACEYFLRFGNSFMLKEQCCWQESVDDRLHQSMSLPVLFSKATLQVPCLLKVPLLVEDKVISATSPVDEYAAFVLTISSGSGLERTRVCVILTWSSVPQQVTDDSKDAEKGA